MSATFRSEAFIVPSLNRASSENIIDDVKVAIMLRDSPRKLECINEDSEHSDYSILDKSEIEDEDVDRREEMYASPAKKLRVVETEEDAGRDVDDVKVIDNYLEPIYDVPFSCREEAKRNIEKFSDSAGEIAGDRCETKPGDLIKGIVRNVILG